jgi:hypothetical protein
MLSEGPRVGLGDQARRWYVDRPYAVFRVGVNYSCPSSELDPRRFIGSLDWLALTWAHNDA